MNINTNKLLTYNFNNKNNFNNKTQCIYYPFASEGKNNRYIQVTNGGLFTCEFSLGFLLKGTFHSLSSGQFGTSVTNKIKYSKDAIQLTLLVFCYTSPTDRKMFYRQNFTPAQNKCFVLGGTVSSPTCDEIPCSSFNNSCYNFSIRCNHN